LSEERLEVRMLEEFPLPQVRTVASRRNYRKYEIGPLESGYGTVFGNTLRRVLLASLPGAAVTSIRIEGVQHEFQDMPHALEDVTDVVLAIKRLRLRAFADGPLNLSLEVSGEQEVTAAAIVAPGTVQVVNPDLHLVTLVGEQARLAMELVVEVGVGFSQASTREGQPIGVIPVDALYSPVQKVNFRVEQLHMAQRTGWDLLWIEIWTDGAMSPDEALRQGAEILVRQFSPFAHFQSQEPARPPQAPATGVSIPPQVYDAPVETLDLSVRSCNCLKRSKISVVGQLLEMSESDLLALKNFGEKSLQELASRLRERALLPSDAIPPSPI
jgi:DNA-directed RNA polymerase subunit alpha